MSARTDAKLRAAAEQAVTEAWDAPRTEALTPEFWEQNAVCEERLADAYHALMLLTDNRAVRMALLDAEQWRRDQVKHHRERAAAEASSTAGGVR